jgi:hypothetical protein
MTTFLPTWTTPSGVVASAPAGAPSRWLAFVWFLRLMGRFPWAVGSPGSLRIRASERGILDSGPLPLPWGGTDDERLANERTHFYSYSGGPEDADVRCSGCDSRPSHKSAKYPCGPVGWELMPRCWPAGTTLQTGVIATAV